MSNNYSTGLRNRLLGNGVQGIGGVDTITNGLFATNTAGWSNSNATLAQVGSGGPTPPATYVSVANSGSNQGYAYQSFTTLKGAWYRASIYFKAGTASSGQILIGVSANDSTFGSQTGLSNAGWVLFNFIFQATGTTTVITLSNGDSTSGHTSLFAGIQCLWDVSGLKDIFYLSFLDVYSGSQPANADAAPTGTLLFTASNSGGATGLTFATASGGVITKNPSEVWTGTTIGVGGSAGYYRLRTAGDSAALSITDCRIDGAIATSGAELIMSNTAIVSGAVNAISNFQVTINVPST